MIAQSDTLHNSKTNPQGGNALPTQNTPTQDKSGQVTPVSTSNNNIIENKSNATNNNEVNHIEHRTLTNTIRLLNTAHKGNLVLAKASREVVSVEGTHRTIPTVITEQIGDVLHIHNESTSQYSVAPKIFVVAPLLEQIEIKGQGNILCMSLIKVPAFTLKHSGAGDVKLWVDVDFLSIELEGSGNIILAGKCQKVRIIHHGAGDIRAYELVTQSAETFLKASGNIEIHPLLTFRADVLGSGSIYYKGKPSQQLLSIEGSGNILQV